MKRGGVYLPPMWTKEKLVGGIKVPDDNFFTVTLETPMLNAAMVQDFLRQFEPLREVNVSPKSELLLAPHLVRLHGDVLIYGERHGFEADLDLLEFGGQEDLMKLAQQLLKTFAAAGEVVKRERA